jgi:hypothetical protein
MLLTFQLFLRTEGIDEFRTTIMEHIYGTKSWDVGKLQKIYNALKINPRTNEPFHSEIIVQIHGRTVFGIIKTAEELPST